ncbi:TolC family outer membrane protein [Chiayiivirga flava]|uniref:Outer membrane protein n=1 Tax=Chiayiivirga flava TaxID=659595 RepID=A0A7W8D6Z0_9GAMM|nr:outer membrane protein [Chiayiivirga flava]
MTALPRLRPLCAALLLSCAAGAAPAADLMQAYDLARQSDPQLAAADANRLVTQEGVPQARSNLLPQISASAGYNRTRSDSEGSRVISIDPPIISTQAGSSENSSRSYGIDLTQSIYDHRNYTNLRASRSRSAGADATYDAANDALMVRVAEAYFNTLTAIDSLAFARAEERAVKRQLDQADQRFEVGLTAITDVHEARARYDSSRANAIAAEVFLDDAREALTEITGQAMTNLQGLSDDFAPSKPVPDDIARWVETALAENPTLLAQEYAVQAAGHDISTARAGHLPYLTGSASYGKGFNWGESRSGGFTEPSNNEGTDKTIGIQLVVPIFTGGLTQSRVRQAIYTRDANEDVLEQQRRAVTRQTRNAFRSLLAGISEIEARRQALVSAQSALEATEAGFEVGTRTIVDVLISQQTLFSAQSGYSTSRHNFLVNTLRLKQAAGTIAINDVQDVNRNLVRDAEAALDLPPSADGSAITPDGESQVEPVEPVEIEPVPQVPPGG